MCSSVIGNYLKVNTTYRGPTGNKPSALSSAVDLPSIERLVLHMFSHIIKHVDFGSSNPKRLP
jgi:hypothetical protein